MELCSRTLRRRRVREDQGQPSGLARFEALFREHQHAVLAYAMRRTQTAADAEDVAAETFSVCWRRLDSVPQETALPWLYGVARRVLANHRRGISRRERLLSVLRSPDIATPEKVGQDQDAPALRALAALSAADQELLRLVAWEELNHTDIAMVLGITPNAVAIRLHRARARFARALKDLDPIRTQVDVTGTEGAAWKGRAS
jgi:RNA polymerase sigma-70 factor (ECF subfamily)